MNRDSPPYFGLSALNQWRSEAQTRALVRRKPSSKGCGLLSRTLVPDLALFVPGQDTGQNRSEGRADGSNFRYQKRSPRSANSRLLRWVVMRNPRANAGFHSIHIGQEPRSGASWHLASCHLTSDECNEDSARFRGGLFHYFIDRDLRNLCK